MTCFPAKPGMTLVPGFVSGADGNACELCH